MHLAGVRRVLYTTDSFAAVTGKRYQCKSNDQGCYFFFLQCKICTSIINRNV